MPLCCVECKPCNAHCLPGVFKSRRPAQQLRRALGKMKVGGARRQRRPRRPGSFSSVRAVFWPLMSMRSEADARNDDDTFSSSGARAPPPSVQQDDGGGTAARVIALQARLGGEAEAPRAPTPAKASMTAAAPAGDDEKKAIHGDVEAACRGFERQLMEMLVEERKVMDLTDVEELLCCWDKLTCPAFLGLVGRFYGDLCMDLFSSSAHQSEEDLSVF